MAQAVTFTVPTVVLILPLAVLSCVPVWLLTRWVTKLLYRLADRWERREVAKLSPENQACYWKMKEERR